MGGWKLIVVGYDGTRQAETALKRAAALAQTLGSKMIVADVASPDPLQGTPGAFGLTPYYFGTVEQRVRMDEAVWQQHRENVESFLADTGTPHEFASLVGAPATEIVDVAAQHHADLIVVGTREPGFLDRLLGGSVSQGVARRARCDVLIVHQPDDPDPANPTAAP